MGCGYNLQVFLKTDDVFQGKKLFPTLLYRILKSEKLAKSLQNSKKPFIYIYDCMHIIKKMLITLSLSIFPDTYL